MDYVKYKHKQVVSVRIPSAGALGPKSKTKGIELLRSLDTKVCLIGIAGLVMATLLWILPESLYRYLDSHIEDIVIGFGGVSTVMALSAFFSIKDLVFREPNGIEVTRALVGAMVCIFIGCIVVAKYRSHLSTLQYEQLEREKKSLVRDNKRGSEEYTKLFRMQMDCYEGVIKKIKNAGECK